MIMLWRTSVVSNLDRVDIQNQVVVLVVSVIVVPVVLVLVALVQFRHPRVYRTVLMQAISQVMIRIVPVPVVEVVGGKVPQGHHALNVSIVRNLDMLCLIVGARRQMNRRRHLM